MRCSKLGYRGSIQPEKIWNPLLNTGEGYRLSGIIEGIAIVCEGGPLAVNATNQLEDF